jgi:peptide/nickel transport system substrate-binding protein
MKAIASFLLGLTLISTLLGCEQESALVIANATDISTLDPYAMFSRVEQSVADHVIQTLTFRDHGMNVVPMLATRWRRLEDNLTWELALRDSVRFHNGEVFNADAVKFSIDLLNQRNTEGKTLGGATVAIPAAEITHVEVIDLLNIRVTTQSPKALLPFNLSQMAIVAPESYAAASDADRARQLVGTGPYIVQERIRDSHITLTPNPEYWGPPPTIERITFRAIPEISTRIAEVETGGVHIVPGLPIDQAQILNDAPDVRVKTIPGGRRVMIGMTTQGGPVPLQDKRVRQALNYAIDFDAINEGLFMGQAKRMSHVFNPPFAHETLTAYSYDPQKAKALLAEAGYPNGFTLQSLDTPIGRWIQDYELAQALAAQLKTIGITFQDGVRSFEWGNYRQKLLSYDLPGLFMQASGGEFELATEAADLSITSPSNFYRWHNDEYEVLWKDLQQELDLDRRMEIGLQMQEIIHEEAPWIFLYIQLDTYGVSQRIEWEPRMDELIHLWDVSFADVSEHP